MLALIQKKIKSPTDMVCSACSLSYWPLQKPEARNTKNVAALQLHKFSEGTGMHRQG